MNFFNLLALRAVIIVLKWVTSFCVLFSSEKAIVEYEKWSELKAITDEITPDNLLVSIAEYETLDISSLDEVAKIAQAIVLEVSQSTHQFESIS